MFTVYSFYELHAPSIREPRISSSYWVSGLKTGSGVEKKLGIVIFLLGGYHQPPDCSFLIYFVV